jgi:hypothetical protein
MTYNILKNTLLLLLFYNFVIYGILSCNQISNCFKNCNVNVALPNIYIKHYTGFIIIIIIIYMLPAIWMQYDILQNV